MLPDIVDIIPGFAGVCLFLMRLTGDLLVWLTLYRICFWYVSELL